MKQFPWMICFMISLSLREADELLKIINGAKKTADILPVWQVAVTLHKN